MVSTHTGPYAKPSVTRIDELDTNCKVREIALKILHKTWRAWFDRVESTELSNSEASPAKWQNHVEFRNQLVVIIEKITELFPQNASYIASAIKLQTLAARYYVQHADSFDLTGDQLSLVADLLRRTVYMDQKEQVRVASVKSLSSLIPMMSARPLKTNIFFQSALNYESYLKMMQCLVFTLTDENPEVRCFIVNQGLSMLFNKTGPMSTPCIKNVLIQDTNENLAMINLFDALTNQAMNFEEISQDQNAVQTDIFAQMDMMQAGL